MTTPTSAATYYARLGWEVGPAHWIRNGRCTCREGVNCGNPGKHPRWHHDLFPNGAHSATSESRAVERLFGRWPQANIFVRTGAGLAVLDVDPRAGGDESLAELISEHGTLPDTPTVLTGGGGEHYHFAVDVRVGSCTLAPGVELKAGRGSLVILPPSSHISGQHYEWEASSGPETPRAPLPQWIIDLAHQNSRPSPDLGDGWAADWLRSPIKDGDGRRGPEGLPRIVGYLRGHAIDCETAVAIVELWDLQNPVPLGAEEVRKHVEGMYKRYRHPARITFGQRTGRKLRTMAVN